MSGKSLYLAQKRVSKKKQQKKIKETMETTASNNYYLSKYQGILSVFFLQ